MKRTKTTTLLPIAVMPPALHELVRKRVKKKKDRMRVLNAAAAFWTTFQLPPLLNKAAMSEDVEKMISKRARKLRKRWA